MHNRGGAKWDKVVPKLALKPSRFSKTSQTCLEPIYLYPNLFLFRVRRVGIRKNLSHCHPYYWIMMKLSDILY